VKRAVPVPLDTDHVLLGQASSSRRDVVQAIGDVMLARGEVTPRYVEGMFRKEEAFGTWVTEGVAMPHGTNDVKGEVLRNSVVVVQTPEGVDWGQGKIVYLAIGFAGRGDDEHVKLMTSIARVLQDKNLMSQLRTTTDKREVVRIMTNDEM
jgi:mannitol/fructose-specific phosphotransferase system IIA component